MTPPNTPVIRTAIAEDVARIGAIAHAAYSKYVPRIGRPPAPMVTDYNVQVAAGRAVVVAVAETVTGYMIAWPQADAYFIDNMAVDPASQGLGLGRRLIEHAVTQANRLRLPALRLYTNELMTENRSMYAHLGFVETHRVIEDRYHRVYMLRHLPNAKDECGSLPRER